MIYMTNRPYVQMRLDSLKLLLRHLLSLPESQNDHHYKKRLGMDLSRCPGPAAAAVEMAGPPARSDYHR